MFLVEIGTYSNKTLKLMAVQFLNIKVSFD